NIGTRTGSVLDEKLLAEPLRQPLAHQACRDVGCASGWKSDDDVHRAGRISSRPCDAREGLDRSSARSPIQKATTGDLLSRRHLRRTGRPRRSVETFHLSPLLPFRPFPKVLSARGLCLSLCTLKCYIMVTSVGRRRSVAFCSKTTDFGVTRAQAASAGRSAPQLKSAQKPPTAVDAPHERRGACRRACRWAAVHHRPGHRPDLFVGIALLQLSFDRRSHEKRPRLVQARHLRRGYNWAPAFRSRGL